MKPHPASAPIYHFRPSPHSVFNGAAVLRSRRPLNWSRIALSRCGGDEAGFADGGRLP